MEEDNENPSEINRIHVKNARITNIVYLNKKRKFQEDQQGLPMSKHKCCEHALSSECDSLLNKSPENEDFSTHMINVKFEGRSSYDGSDESAKDSNSFIADADSVMSAYGESKFEPEYAQTSAYYQPSTLSAKWASGSFQNTLYSLDSRIVTNTGAGKEELTYMVEGNHPHSQNGKFKEKHHIEEQLLEFDDLKDYSCSKYGNDTIEQCKEKELEDMLYSSGTNPNNYVLSSGRWIVNREAQLATKKPTIDQEFEQYFSTLMLS